MTTEYLSIKDFAAKVGVSQQAIYKQLNNKLKPYLKVVENKKYLHISALDEYTKTENNSTVEQQLLNVLQADLKVLHEQISEKDKQIENLQRLLDQEQHLNAMNHEKILLLESKLEEPPNETEQPVEPDSEPEQQKGFWNRLFRK
jgi:predicted RNase H-like nuclease (RuvC/YqgF family)